jgi:5-methyltetrahydropteroyltriglutamate--homocysteine methyltransferase
LIFAQDRNLPYDPAEFERVIGGGVVDIVRQQKEAGVDIPSDGEMGKISYATYIRHRLTGFEGDSPRPTPIDIDEIPEFRDRLLKLGASASYLRPVCKGPIAIKNLEPVHEDIRRMQAALKANGMSEGFLNAVSPGTISVFQPNEYYPTHEAYMEALAEVMKVEYETIVASGLLLQIDCPDLAMGRHSRFHQLTDEQFIRNAHIQVDALNHALQNVPADRVRLHMCWGNYEGPHNYDLTLTQLLPVLLKVKPQALLFEGANPRHEWEWKIWHSIKVPKDKILVPGVIATSYNYVEHPETIAERIMHYAEAVGPERVIAGTDCGFGTFAGFGPIHPTICWMKLRSLRQGADLAGERLFKKNSKGKKAAQKTAAKKAVAKKIAKKAAPAKKAAKTVKKAAKKAVKLAPAKKAVKKAAKKTVKKAAKRR